MDKKYRNNIKKNKNVWEYNHGSDCLYWCYCDAIKILVIIFGEYIYTVEILWDDQCREQI